MLREQCPPYLSMASGPNGEHWYWIECVADRCSVTYVHSTNRKNKMSIHLAGLDLNISASTLNHATLMWYRPRHFSAMKYPDTNSYAIRLQLFTLSNDFYTISAFLTSFSSSSARPTKTTKTDLTNLLESERISHSHWDVNKVNNECYTERARCISG